MPPKISHNLLNHILQMYDLDLANWKINQTESGYRNTIISISPKNNQVGHQKLALIIYKDDDDILKKIKLANFVSNQLAELGWPTRQTIGEKTSAVLKIKSHNQTRYCCLYNYLPGDTISWESYSQKHLKLLGQVLGFLHKDLVKISTNSPILVDDVSLILEEKIEEMYKYFADDGVTSALEQKLKLQVSLDCRRKFLPLIKQLQKIEFQQLLHMDFVRGNLLFCKQNNCQFVQDSRLIFDNNKKSNQQLVICGILDFEKVAYGPREVELARTLAFLLVDCKYKLTNKIVKYFLHSGYIKRGEQRNLELDIIFRLVHYYLFQDFYHFLLHNPYESLPQNEHFRRTLKLLLIQNNPLLILQRQN